MSQDVLTELLINLKERVLLLSKTEDAAAKWWTVFTK